MGGRTGRREHHMKSEQCLSSPACPSLSLSPGLCLRLCLAEVLPVQCPACHLACSLRQKLCVSDAMEPQRPCLAALCSLAGRGGRVWVGSDKILKEGGMAARLAGGSPVSHGGISRDIQAVCTPHIHTTSTSLLSLLCVCAHECMGVYTMSPFLFLHG